MNGKILLKILGKLSEVRNELSEITQKAENIKVVRPENIKINKPENIKLE